MAYQVCPPEYRNPSCAEGEDAPQITSYRVVTETTSALTGKQIALTLLKGVAYEDAVTFAKEYAVEKNVSVDVYARFDNGMFMVACGYAGDAGELITDFEEEEPEYAKDYAKEF